MNTTSQANTTPLPNRRFYPLTHPQKRIWYIEKLYPNTSLYNIGGTSTIHGPVDFGLLEEALQLFIQKNDGIRFHFREQNGEARQYVSDYHRTPLDFADFCKAARPEAEFEAWLNAHMQRPFQLIDNDLFYIALFKLAEGHAGIFVKFHHIIADGWSIKVISEQIYGMYQQLIQGQLVAEKVVPSYLEYLDYEREYLNSERFLKNRAFWMEQFKELPEPLFPGNSEDLAGRRAKYQLEYDLSARIKEFTAKSKCSLNTFFVGLFLIYLAKTTQNNDLVIGTPVLNRSGKKEKGMFGMFTSTMPFRFRLNPAATAPRLFADINEALLKFYFHQRYPYDLLAQDLELKKKGYDQLFQVAVNYYNTRLDNEVNGFIVEDEELYNGNQLYLLQMVIKDWARQGPLTLELDHKLDYFTERQIHQMWRSLVNLAGQILADPTRSIAALRVLPEEEYQWQIRQFNATARDYPSQTTIHQLFEAQADRTPDRIAIRFGQEQLTYRELNHKSNRLAAVLRQKGVAAGAIVGLMVVHSIETVAAILGIIKAGGAYLPIDPEYPAERIQYMLSDSGCHILLSNCNPKETLEFSGESLQLNDPGLYTGEGANPASVNRPEDPVYVIYTSGSTGKPKGVVIEHRGLVNYIWWARRMYLKGGDDAFALYSSLSFDLTVTSIFCPLIGGRRIEVYRDDGPEYALFRIMKESRVSVVKLTPSHLSLLQDMDNRHSSVKRFIVGGEDLKTSLAAKITRSFGGNIEIYNEYGPTETVVGCMIHQFHESTDTSDSVPIGIPADNVQIYILDKDLNPLPEGCLGEMYISGDGVAGGYLNRPELTRERFIENPFRPGQMMYRTGDLAKFLPDGKIEYAGRSDRQIKIRGYRVELGEIERHLLKYHQISDAVVIDRVNPDGDKYLCAYIVTHEEVPVTEVKSYLAKRLPGYMVPFHWVRLAEIPLTVNGKVDRGRLPEPVAENAPESDFIAPRNEAEAKLAEVISQALHIRNIGMKDNFYHYGGDSIKAIQVAGKLNELGLKIKARDILSHPVLEEMALCLEQGAADAHQTPCSGAFKPTPIVAWFLSQNFQNPNHYNQSVLLNFKQDISAAQLGLILDELVKHHDSLRLNYDKHSGELYYNDIYLTQKNSVEYHDLSGMAPEQQDRQIFEAGAKIKSSLDIEGTILIRAGFFGLGKRGKRVLLTAHHLVVDGVSWRIIMEDLARIYDRVNSEDSLSLPPGTHSMSDWSRRLTDYAAIEPGAAAHHQEIEYWNRVIRHPFQFPADMAVANNATGPGVTLSSVFETAETAQLTGKANVAFGTRADELMITALVLTISDIIQENEIVIELEGHGREDLFEDMDISRTVGWFTSMYPVVLRKTGTELAGQIKAVKEQLRQVPHKGVGFGILKYTAAVLNDHDSRPVRFNFLGDLDIAPNELLEVATEDSGPESGSNNHMTALIEINAMIFGGRLKVELTYGAAQFKPETMSDFLQRFAGQIRRISDFCNSYKIQEHTPSDFEMVKFSQDDLDALINQL
jgi:amino acid adenylation domain-containing protein/non-ribosomal peptide synthase protein (TIGR01720 family)